MSQYQKGKTDLDFTEETVSGSGISWDICKSASRSRQITTRVPHHSSFLQAGCPSCCPTNSVKALKAISLSTQACKNSVIRSWCGYPSKARCRLLAYGPADATASPKPCHLLPYLNPAWFYLVDTGLPRLSWKRDC